MEPPGRLADNLAEARLDIHMDVLESARERECPGGDLALYLLEAPPNLRRVRMRDDPLFRQHLRMRLGAADVLRVEAPVEVDRGVDLLHHGIGARRKPAAPHPVGHALPLD